MSRQKWASDEGPRAGDLPPLDAASQLEDRRGGPPEIDEGSHAGTQARLEIRPYRSFQDGRGAGGRSHRHVDVGIDEPRHDGSAAEVDALAVGGDRSFQRE